MPQTDPEIRPGRSRQELQEALEVRIHVFVEEQGGPAEDEPDAWDDAARHFVVLDAGRIIGTARLYQPCTGVARIGRVALLAEYRGRGWGEVLIRDLLGQARALGFREVVLDSQTYACPFYERFGFRAEGEEFLDGGIPHRRMRLSLKEGSLP